MTILMNLNLNSESDNLDESESNSESDNFDNLDDNLDAIVIVPVAGPSRETRQQRN